MKNRTSIRIACGLLSWLLLLTGAVRGQVVIRGVVVDAQQTPIANANVSLLNTFAGASSETDGTFSFTTDQRGNLTIQARCLGYADQILSIRVGDTTRVVQKLQLVLTERSVMLEGVTIRSRKTNFLATEGLTSLRPLEVRAMGGGNADIGNGIRALPGVQATTDATGLFVRGGTADETTVYVDGMAVRNFFYVGSPDVSQRGRYAPDLFSGTAFSSGGYSALYGQAMSGALILESTGVATRSSVGGNVSSTGAALEYTRLVRPGRLSAGATLNYTNVGQYYQLVPQRRTYTGSPESVDLIVNLKYKTAKGGMLRLLGSLGTNTLQFVEQPFGQATQYGLRSRNAFSSLTYTGSLGRTWTVNAGFALTLAGNRYRRDSLLRPTDTNWTGNTQTVEQQNYTTRLVFRRALTNAADLYVGAEHTIQHVSSEYARQDGRSFTLRADGQYGAVFAESNISLTRAFQARIGLRAEGSLLLHDAAVSPRLWLQYTLNKRARLTTSFGQFYQQPGIDYLLRQPDRLNFQRATHYILTYQYTDLHKLLRVELYHKQYDHLIRTMPDTSSGGTGYASGLEVFWKEDSRIKNVNYWVTYSYLDTKRQYLGYPVAARPGYAAPHTVTLVVNVLLPRIPLNIGLTYTGAAGRPYYNPNRTESDFLTDCTPAYHNVGLTVAYLSRFFKSNSTLAFSVSNLLGNQQVFGYKYNGLTERVASTPLATRFFYVGLFLNWGTAQPAKTGNLPIPNAN
jgi:vitamin B12 transporter